MAKRIPAGRMRHTVTLQDYSTALNSYGQASTTGDWRGNITVRASVEPLRGNEAVLARQVYPHASYRLIVDYRSELDTTGVTTKRVRFGSHLLHIGAILNYDEENFQQELLCGEDR